MKIITLTTKNARKGLSIISKTDPKWGTWTLNQDRNGWVIKRNGRGCECMLDESEFHFWALTAPTTRAN